MRSHIYIRPLNVLDEGEKAAFVRAVEDSGKFFPRNVFTLPQTRVMVAEKREHHGMEVIAYQPHYPSLVLGSFIPVSLNDRERASAMHMLTGAAYTRAHEQGLADIIVQSNTAETIDFALRHGYTKAHDTLRLDIR